MSKKIVIIGGVAAGASAAARLRRLSEDAEIHIVERSPYVSFANCGLPYYIGGEIKQRSKLLLHTPDSLHKRFNINVHIRTTATAIHPPNKTVSIRDAHGSEKHLAYDELILAPGASPILPPLKGIKSEDGSAMPSGVFTLRDIEDMDAINSFLDAHTIKQAIIIGGGYIGVELAEQMVHRTPKVVLVEGAQQILAPFDPEIAGILERRLREHVEVFMGSLLQEVQRSSSGAVVGVRLANGTVISGEMVILALGVKPEVTLAKDAGIALGPKGGILVNEYLQTSEPHIWAVGDAIEVSDMTTQEPALIPLAGPANRQGRMVADNIVRGKQRRYQGTLGTAVLRVFDLIAASTGANEKRLNAAGIAYEKLYLFPNSHSGYYPGAQQINLKVLFSKETRTLLGAQAVGKDGVDKRIDVLATAICGRLTIDQIAELELCYAPPVGSAKDPVNMAGMAMQNVADSLVTVLSPEDLNDELVLDVRTQSELEAGSLAGAIHIPLDDLRARHTELPRDRRIAVYCLSGQRSYSAARILTQLGFDAVNITGAWKSIELFQKLAGDKSTDF